MIVYQTSSLMSFLKISHAPILALCLFSLLFVSYASDIECIQEDRAMLLRIKQAFSSPESPCFVSWTPSSHCCNWTGVTCHAKSRHVTELSLDYCGITGELPNDFFIWTKNLSLVQLVENQEITGHFPEFPKNSALQTLRFSRISLSGSIPDSIGNLKDLRYLEISLASSITGTLPSSIGNLTKLTHLELWGNGLTGVIPSFIGNLAHLSSLNLGSNEFKGVIPESVGKLVNLTQMDLISNHLTGEIPSSIKYLAKLELMDLRFNSVSGPIPMSLFTLPSLTDVYLSNNHLSGQIEEFSNPSATLRSIDLSFNQIEGQIPKSLFKLPALERLLLTSNNFGGTVDLDLFATPRNLTEIDISYNRIWVQENNYNYFRSFPKLIVFNLASCNLTKVPEFLKLQNNITAIDISNNRISGNIPRWLWTLESLMDLNISNNMFMHYEDPVNQTYSSGIFVIDLSFNKLQGPIPFPPLNIIYLDYSNNNFSSHIPSNLSLYLNDTEFLSIANNSLTGEIPQSIGESELSLIVLDFSNNYLTGPIPPNILNSPYLVLLKLNGNNLEGAFPSRVNGMCQIRAILVSENHLNEMVPKSLLNCSEMEVIDVANNHISGLFPFWLGNFTNLSILTLNGNRFYGPVELTESIGFNSQFLMIQILDISSNSFSGNLPSKLFNNFQLIKNASALVPGGVDYVTNVYEGLAKFDYGNILAVRREGYTFTVGRILKILYTSIDFSNNHFEGDIPNMISELNGLRILNLSHNALTGHIPPSIGKMKQLEKLDLSDNYLSGNIPQELASLNFLSHLNLSENNLSGLIPQMGQLMTFTNNSFNGNQELCGSPLSKLCGNNSSSTKNSVPSDSDSTYVIGMALSIGLGYGFGIAIVFLCQPMSWKYWIKKITNKLVYSNGDS